MQLDPDPKTAMQQIAIAVVSVVSFVFVVATFGFSAWYSPLLVLIAPISLVAVFVARSRKERREAGGTR